MNIAEVIEAAARRLETHGWMQGGGVSEPHDVSPTCASNAIFFVAGADQWTAQSVLARHLRGDTERGLGNIWAWNDAPGQTKENVIATMRACAAIWRAKQENTDASKTAGPEVRLQDSGTEPQAGIPRGEVCDDIPARAEA